MKPLIGLAMIAGPLAGAIASSPADAQVYCPSCPIQSKVPSTKTPGEFDYVVRCTDDQNGTMSSGNTAEMTLTEPSDQQAMSAIWSSPKMDQILVGLEGNSYACAHKD